MIREWKKRRYKQFEQRIVKRFAWFPCFVSHSWDDRVDNEMRWLKTVYILQKFNCSWGDCWWENKCFVTEAEYLDHLEKDAKILGDLR